MPISRDQVLKTLNSATSALATLTNEIDRCMQDPKYVRDWCRGGSGNKHWSFVVGGTLSETDKEDIIKMYKDAGWSKIEAGNSEDNGERPGLCGLTLYA